MQANYCDFGYWESGYAVDDTVKGQIRRKKLKTYFIPFVPRPTIVDASKSVNVEISSDLLFAQNGNLTAFGDIHVHILVSIQGAKTTLKTSDLYANGIINPTDEELMFLLAD